MGDEKNPAAGWEAPYARGDFRRIWRMTNGNAVLLVSARMRSATCTEIWLVEKQTDRAPQVSQQTFDEPPHCEEWLMAKKQALEAQGWREDKGF